MRKANFHGYTIYEDGTIISLYGRKMKANLKNGRYEIKLHVEGKRRNYIVSRLVYYVFNNFDMNDKDVCISYKDGNKENIHLDNLYLTHRKDLIQGEKHKARSKLTDTQIKEIRELYKGKAGTSQYDKTSLSLQDLANIYGVSKGNIAMIIRGESRNDKDYKLK